MEDQNKRRDFLKSTVALGAITAISGISFISGCKEKAGEEKDVSPTEDLMQEHGLISRILLIYDTCKLKLVNKESFSITVISDASTVIRELIQDYHEKQEENYLFTRFQKANQLTDLVEVLIKQHNLGRNITDQILQSTKTSARTESENQKLVELLTSFNSMYRPHKAREDTVLYPAFRKLVSQDDYKSLGKEFDKSEEKVFGKDGFEKMLNRVSEIEKKLDIYTLAKFTPQA